MPDRSISEALTDARARLTAAPFSPPTREAGLLLAHVLGWSEARVLARQEAQLDAEQRRRFEEVLGRRLQGEPVAYIVGSKEFYGRRFVVDPRVLIPRPETEHLVEAVLELELPARPTLVDLGTGSGCIACSLALELAEARVFAADVSLGALVVAWRNVRQLDCVDRVTLLASDLATGLDLSAVDLVVSNPPYVGALEVDTLSPEIVDFEPASALFAGPSGDRVHRRLLSELAAMPTGSWLVIEIGAGQHRLISRLADGSAFELLEIRPDYAGHPRIAVLQRV